jgi:hypothetical protein
MKHIFFHQGLGDQIICNGLSRALAENEDITIFAYEHNFKNVSFMYKDNKKINITCLPQEEYDPNFIIKKYSKYDGFINASMYSQTKVINCENWDEIFYQLTNVPFQNSWNKFYYTRNMDHENELFNKLNPNNKKIAIIHPRASDNVNRIDYSKIHKDLVQIEIDKQYSFFDYGLLIEKAEEVHCVNSSFLHFADRIQTNGKLFFHKNYKIRGLDNFSLKKEWLT